ncbi:MAG: FUN14 domain-containing protein [Candidatus Zipacnadales bacterium]
MDFLFPFVGMLGFGGLMGYAVGFAAKKVSKLALIGMGILFFCIQYLVYKGWATVDWGSVAEEGGKFVKATSVGFWKIVTYNVTLGAGFVGGIILGLKKG